VADATSSDGVLVKVKYYDFYTLHLKNVI